MFKFPCPQCQAKLRCEPTAVGKKIKCPKCSTSVTVPEPEPEVLEEVVPIEEPKKTSKLASANVAVKPKTKPPLPPEEESEEIIAIEEPKKTSKLAAKSTVKPSRKQQEDDEDDEDEAPRKKSKASKKRSHDDDEEKSGSSRALLWVGGGVGVFVCVVGIVAVILFTQSSGKKTDPITPMAAGPTAPMQTMAANASLPRPADKANEKKDDKKDEKKAPGKPVAASKNDIYRHVLKSTAWIVNLMNDGRAVTGTGSVVDKKNRLLLTNYHVVFRCQQVVVLFPVYEGDKLIAEKENYMKRVTSKTLDAIPARVIAQDAKRDLALIQLDSLPDGVLPLALSDKSATTGDDVLSVGNPGSSSSLWMLTTGTVRQVSHKKWKALIEESLPPLELEADVVETQSPTNHGDSGGPMVNTSGEMVGVTQGGTDPSKAQLLSTFIDVKEARDFIEKTCQSNGVAWDRADRKVATYVQGDVTELIKDLDSPDAKVRAQAAQTLADMGPNARPAVVALLRKLKDADELCRTMAQNALEKIGAPDKSAIAVLKESLKDIVPALRIYASEALGKLGPDALSAGPALIESLKDTEPVVRQNAARSLGRIGFDDRTKLVAELTPLLEDENKAVRVAAAESLTSGSSLGASDVAFIEKLLKHRDMEVRLCAARGLGKLGLQAKGAIPTLVTAFKDTAGKEARRAIIEVLALFGADAKAALPVFIDAMSDQDLRVMASLAISKLGPDAKPAVPALSEALTDSNDEVRKNCLIALAKIGPDARDAVPALKPLLRDRRSPLRMQVLATFEEIGPGASDAVNELIELLGESVQVERNGQLMLAYNKDLHDKLTDVLGKIGKGAITPLHQALNNKHKLIRLGAVVALGKIGPEGKGAAQALNFLSQNDNDGDVRNAAVIAYQKVIAKKPPPPPVKPKTTK